MRAGLVIIGPLIPILKVALNLSNTQLSILTGIPMACYSISSLLMPHIAKLGSSNRIIKFALVSLAIGFIGRASFGVWALYAFTVLIGISIAILNYELPVWVKSHGGQKSGLITGIYTTLMGLSSGLAVAITIPLAEMNSLSWRMAMAPWILIAIVSAIYWVTRMKEDVIEEKPKQLNFWKTKAFRDPVAWALVLFFGFESLTFYATATWFPTLLTTKGFTLSHAAIAVSVTGLLGSTVGLFAPSFVAKFQDRRLVLAIITGMAVLGFFMIGLQSGMKLIVWMALSNISLSCVFPVVLLLTGDKSNSAEQTRNLSTMMQSVGYAISAFGPFIMGQIFELSNSWNIAMFAMSGFSLAQLLAGLIASRPGKIAY